MSDFDSIEEWRAVVGYEGFYEVSSLGRMRSIDRDVPTTNRYGPYVAHWRGKMLTHRIDAAGAGYAYTSLHRDGRQKKVNVHVLVLEAFRGPRPSSAHEACHDDGDKANAKLSNLRWDTKAGNWADKWRHGTATAGEKSGTHVLTEEEVRWILESRQSSLALAPVFGCASSTIRAVRLGQNWGHLKERGYVA